MKVRVVAGTVCGAVAVPVLLAYTQDWLPDGARPFLLAGAGTLVILYLAWLVIDIPRVMFLPLTRGVTGIASDRSRREQFSQPWDRARTSVRSWGVGMTSLSRDTEVIRAAIARGLSVTLEVMDGEWLRDHPDISRVVDETYGRADFVSQVEDSTVRLVGLARELNRQWGADRVRVYAVQAFIPQSATIADEGTARAWGWVEWHTYGFPHGQLRIRVRGYPHRTSLNPPLLTHILSSRRSVPRRRIDERVGDITGPISLPNIAE